MLKLNYHMSRRRFVQSGIRLLASVVVWQTVQMLDPAVPPVLAQASVSAQAYGTGAYGQGVYGGDSCTGGCAQQERRSQPVVSIYLPLINK